MASPAAQQPSAQTDIVLSVRNLTKEFKGFFAVKGVDLNIARGSVHALIGPNGAGKTTCFNLLTKFLQPTAGSIVFNGRDITLNDAADVARLGIVRSFQISAVFPHLTVLENVRVALQRRRGESYDFWRNEGTLLKYDSEAMHLLEGAGIEAFARETAGNLSYGRKRSLEIATTLALEPELLLLDEPMAGMAHEDIDRTAELLQRAAANRTILMVEHNLSVVASLSNRITVLARGEVLADGDYAAVSSDPRVIEAYIGSSDD